MRVIVTGGAGFVGSHLCDRLLRTGCEVVCMDDFSTGSRSNMEGMVGRSGFTLVGHDVIEPYHHKAGRIYNLACPASPAQYQRDPVRTLKTSVMGALNALELAEREGARVLQASTSEVYGDPEVHPQSESYWGHVNPVGVRSCYDEGKRCAETLCNDYRRTRGVDVRVARIFNTYGPRMCPKDGRVVSNFVLQALRGEALTIYGDGSQTRSFCFVDDLVEGLLRLMEGPPQNGPVNIGNPHEITVLELAELVIAKVGGSSRLVHLPLPGDDPRIRKPDIALARSTLGWEPTVSLDEGLERTIAYFRGMLASGGI